MRTFAALYEALDSTTSTNEKVAAMQAYFLQAPPADAAWAVYFLTGRRFRRFITSRRLTEWYMERSGMSPWLFMESYIAVGDTAETIALLLDLENKPAPAEQDEHSLADLVENHLLPLQTADEDTRRRKIFGWWDAFDRREVFMLNKMLSGSLRIGVSQTLVVRALSEAFDVHKSTLSHRLMGSWEPSGRFFENLVTPAAEMQDDHSRPYPFYLAYPLNQPPEGLGEPSDWLAEWKWDGIRAQIIKREGEIFIWSRGEELVTDRFPEITDARMFLPNGTVMDGELLAWSEDGPLPFSVLQTRIGRRKPGKNSVKNAPVVFTAFDLLECGGSDIRHLPLADRRQKLEDLIAEAPNVFRLSAAVHADSWKAYEDLHDGSRERGVEGFILKRLDSPYRDGRRKGDWWKWKVAPYTVDAVLIYAQAGHGRRASLFTDYTFAVWNGDHLVPVAKAYSGLSQEEIETLDGWIRENTRDKFGPVRAVEPRHVFELAFEGISLSGRHKSGVALRFPRIARWRTDKPVAEADTLERLKALIP